MFSGTLPGWWCVNETIHERFYQLFVGAVKQKGHAKPTGETWPNLEVELNARHKRKKRVNV